MPRWLEELLTSSSLDAARGSLLLALAAGRTIGHIPLPLVRTARDEADQSTAGLRPIRRVATKRPFALILHAAALRTGWQSEPPETRTRRWQSNGGLVRPMRSSR